MRNYRMIIFLLVLLATLTGCNAENVTRSTDTPPQQAPAPTDTPDPFSGSGPWEIELGESFSASITGFENPMLIILPDYPGEITLFSSLIQSASENGVGTLTIIPDDQDVLPGRDVLLTSLAEGIAVLKDRGITEFFLLGAGDSAISAIIGSEQLDGLAGLILLSPSWTNGIDTLSADDLSSLRIPSLWLASRQDMLQDSEEMVENVGPSLVTVWIYEGSGLRGVYILDGLDRDDAIRRILDFINENGEK